MTPKYPGAAIWFLLCCSPAIYGQSPGGVSTNLSLWVTAESAAPTTGGTLTGWTEQTHTNTFTRSGSGTIIAPNTINFHPVVRFNGNGKLTGNSFITWSECSTVASWTGRADMERGTVISPTTSGTAVNDASRYYFRSGVEGGNGFLYAGMGSDSIGFEYISAPASMKVNLYTASGVGDVFNQNGLDARVGSLYGGFTKRGTVMTGIPQIGERSTNDSRMIGDIAEIIVYSANNAVGRNKVESYLALKYGLTLGNQNTPINYTSSANTIFWNGRANWQHNIFGIGTDQGSGLTQTSSNSMNSGNGIGMGQSTAGNLVLTSPALSNQQFLMIGTDSASLLEEAVTTANGPLIAVGSQRVFRTWLAQNTNAVGAVTLTFDMTGLSLTGGTTASNYWLMIDNDGDGNFTTGSQSFVKAASLTAPLVKFTPLTLVNNVVFTLITFPASALPLPVTWEDFTATTQQNTAILRWSISDEIRPDHYNVERSTDGTIFSTIAFLPADHPSAQFTEQLSAGAYFYRIRLSDIDGRYQFSPIRSIRIMGSPLLRIRSNPIQGNQLQLDIALLQPGMAHIGITDRRGIELLQKNLSFSNGSNRVNIDLPALAAGLYFVQVQAGQVNSCLPFLKR